MLNYENVVQHLQITNNTNGCSIYNLGILRQINLIKHSIPTMVKTSRIEARTPNEDCKVQASAAIAGGLAGVIVAFGYGPMDTLKTRMQSPQGFQKAGGFRQLYKGCLALIVAAIPTNVVFFGTYETSKCCMEPLVPPQYSTLVYMGCATNSRVLASLTRVPIDLAVQRQQVYFGPKPLSAISIMVDAYKKEGFVHGLYRGLASTLIRDMPYSFIEIPLWELLKASLRKYNNNQEITSLQSAGCAFCASLLATGVTTPCDVVKTRIVLTQYKPGITYDRLRFWTVFAAVYRKFGIRGLCAGMVPRVIGNSVGRFVFFSLYEKLKLCCDQYM